MSSTFTPTFNVQLLREVGLLTETCDVIMTSSVSNLGNVLKILERSYTFIPIFIAQFLKEVVFFQRGLWRHHDIINTKLGPCYSTPRKVIYHYTPIFITQKICKIGPLNKYCDVVMTLSVPNLGWVTQVQERSFAFTQTFITQLLRELKCLNEASDVINLFESYWGILRTHQLLSSNSYQKWVHEKRSKIISALTHAHTHTNGQIVNPKDECSFGTRQ